MDVHTSTASLRKIVLALIGEGRYAEAETRLRPSLDDPSATEFRFLLAWALLGQGAYGEGFQLWEQSRFSAGTAPTGKPHMPVPQWDGGEIRTLILLPDQGLGDQIQFARYIEALRARGVDAHLVPRPEMSDLFLASGYTLATKGMRYDAWAYIGSLPALLKVEEVLPLEGPYLFAPKIDAPALRSGARIGFVWHGDSKHANDSRRSLSRTDADILLRRSDVVSLQQEDTGFKTMAQTAALIEKLDLVVSVDTSVAHLAGALGKPTWVLLPRRFTDWRWMLERSDTPWYRSMTLLRQSDDGIWTPTLSQLINQLP
ncbi:glycosyltransferase family 9 protein [Phenylobacterium aquaticum]|uniref:glycosyltransferase family 9 protein n=1 Tax=Phenylobacterium aquaticum TaxID=1763816 RepID=UPI0034CD4B9D